MATGSIAVFVNRESMGRALAQARRECSQDKSWLNAINRAALNLEACPWQFDGAVLIITSATEPDRRYTVQNGACDCKAFEAGRPCWHRAARRLLIKAAELAQQPLDEPCPMCGQLIRGRKYAAQGKMYIYFPICAGDGDHAVITKGEGNGCRTAQGES